MKRLIAALLAGGVLFGSVLTAGTAASPLPVPRVRTLPAVGIHPTDAVLLGEVNARNGIAHFKFQYGKSKKYETTLETSEEFATGSRNREVAEALTRLRPSTVYHFRIIAFNRSGAVAGMDRTFTTDAWD